MADLIDDANEHAEHLLLQALAQHQRRAGGQATSAEWCESCGVEIPQARRAAVPGCQRCIDCQQLRELKRG
ncbi:MAG: TraR/DksA C4-type zinc finger protein [Gammaproteobacteria bacterium]|uniref:Putative TraR/DksA family transcriptional regulator n=1 Tax=viral metagenome TaxID=1070528 RepID=A0A6M3J680_9ZZZZ|nr:TraR/DksA C4-type zinc finger protein [Gammaproteobacteria bacterium]MBU2067492.1 TraR/DksA C4-type zinc finger protein [Gammaproteobacteria bacterium]MBU2139502.1 TraR/DksA C4-type zinc finger protein [Gammaproteobacteria bacterium]MBU2255929.1 TraR/DksA C4-type zinc finger protein [Gammaproteobacteria bacterium]MBU2295574.1 TraR/DksA C4-type zinc finger protein [Gammaproteobacteria bacterium]